ncbi:MAG: hypothetical protein K0Q70_855, partial [Rhodospirillales bacterium]|nr:hypothetical protein [Rhodospirillales bacterium]
MKLLRSTAVGAALTFSLLSAVGAEAQDVTFKGHDITLSV